MMTNTLFFAIELFLNISAYLIACVIISDLYWDFTLLKSRNAVYLAREEYKDRAVAAILNHANAHEDYLEYQEYYDQLLDRSVQELSVPQVNAHTATILNLAENKVAWKRGKDAVV